MLAAGIARNVTPPRCEVVLDVRTTPAWSHAELVDLVRACVTATVEVISDRLVPAAERTLSGGSITSRNGDRQSTLTGSGTGAWTSST